MDIGAINKTLVTALTPQAGSSTGCATGSSVTPALSGQDQAAAKATSETAQPLSTAMDARKQVEAAVANIREYVQATRRNIDFSVDDGAGRVVVHVTDAESGNVIRQIPSEEALRLAENLSEVRSLLFKAEA